MTGSDAAGRRHRARRGDGDLLRAEILTAAARLLHDRGDPARVSIRAIAAACGVTSPAIYLHFRDKESVFLEVCSEGFREFAARIESAASQVDDPVAALGAAAKEYVRYALARPEQYRVLFLQRSPLPGGVDVDDLPGMSTFRMLEGLIRRAIDSGVFRSVDPFLTATTFWLALHGIASRAVTEQGPPAFPWPAPEALTEYLVDGALHGLLAR
ncbi:MAG: TetR/AcrR family transcriptional regulator [Acidimicrobiia bacterium]|nr:TetR/AcrR family transcriptional regulator [Acidimicrobiia bacterium]